MNSDAVATRGRAPWHPSTSASLGEVWHFHDMPLIGALHYGTVTYAFMCMAGEMSPFNVWVYTPLSTSDLEIIASDKLESLDDLQGFLRRATVGREVVFATSMNEQITHWQPRMITEDVVREALEFLESAGAAPSPYAARHIQEPRGDVEQAMLDGLVQGVSQIATVGS